MRIITDAEAESIIAKPAGNASRLRTMMLQLKTGQILLVERKDWRWKTKAPSVMCRRLERKSTLKFECKVMLDGSGWLIKRVK